MIHRIGVKSDQTKAVIMATVHEDEEADSRVIVLELTDTGTTLTLASKLHPSYADALLTYAMCNDLIGIIEGVLRTILLEGEQDD